MPHKKDFEYANAFKPLSPCHTKKGGASLFELYHGLKNKKIVTKKGGRRVSKNKRKSVNKRKQKGGNHFPKNPPYMLSTAPHKPGVKNLVAPTDMLLYERSFQGPFPSRSGVNFKLERPFQSNNQLVEATPLVGGRKKKVVRKTSKKITRKVSKRGGNRKTSKRKVRKTSKRVVRKTSKSGVRKTSKRRVRRNMRGG